MNKIKLNKIKQIGNWLKSKFLVKTFANVLLIVFCAVVLALSVRGNAGNPTPQELNTTAWKDSGPLELSPERGRFALLYSVVEQHSVTFTPDLARFATPDVGYINGHYVSLFAPAVSFLAIPGYVIGKNFGFSQVGSFAMIGVFALLNVLLIRSIAIRMGAHAVAATIAGLAFLFATPAFAYAVTLYQHHISTFIILASILLLMKYRSTWSLAAIWIMCALSVTIDYPNFFMMLPIGLIALGRTIIAKKEGSNTISVKLPLMRILAIGAVILPMIFFMWFNKVSYGDPLQLSGTVDRSVQINKDGTPVLESEQVKARIKAEEAKTHKKQEIPEKSALGFFNSRLLMQGFYTYFVSPDRGMLVYTPVMFFAIAGMVLAIKKRAKYAALLIAVIGFNVVLYSMWDDPYGGWAFGSRYLIPSYALLSVFLAMLLTWGVRYWVFAALFFSVVGYSVAVNTLGAATSNMNPPKVEAIALEQKTGIKQPYTFERNINLLNENVSKSFVFKSYAADHISARNYVITIAGVITAVFAGLLLLLKLKKGVRYAV